MKTQKAIDNMLGSGTKGGIIGGIRGEILCYRTTSEDKELNGRKERGCEEEGKPAI